MARRAAGAGDDRRQAPLLAAIDELKPTSGAANFLNCFRLASSLDSDDDVARCVVVFTDGQGKGWSAEARGVWARLRAAIDRSSRDVRFEVVAVDVPPPVGANLSIDRVVSSRQVAAEGELIAVTAQVSNTGSAHAPSSRVSWKIDGEQQGETELPQLGVGQTASVAWRTSFDSPGVRDVSALIELTDLLALDNEAGVVVEVVEAIPILVLVPQTGLEAEGNAFLAACSATMKARSAILTRTTRAASGDRSLSRRSCASVTPNRKA